MTTKLVGGLFGILCTVGFALAQTSQPLRLPVLQDGYDKKTVTSLSGSYSLTLTPDRPGGYGGADYLMKRGSQVVWHKHLPFFLHDLVIGKEGGVVGCEENLASLEIWRLSPGGVPSKFQSYERKGDGGDGAPDPLAGPVVGFDTDDSALVEVFGLPKAGSRLRLGTEYLLFDLASGRLKKSWQNPPQLQDVFSWDVFPISGTNLAAIAQSGAGPSLTVVLIDPDLNIVWKQVVSKGMTTHVPDYPVAPDDRTAFLPCNGAEHFAIWAADWNRIEYAVSNVGSKWSVREFDRQPYDPTVFRRAAISASPLVVLEPVKSVDLGFGAEGQPDSFEFEVSNSGEFCVYGSGLDKLLVFRADGALKYVYGSGQESYSAVLRATLNRDGSVTFGTSEGLFVISADGRSAQKWVCPDIVKGYGVENLQPADGLCWVARSSGLWLADSNGKVIKHYTHRLDGGLVDYVEALSASTDGSLCMLTRPEPELALALPGDPAHLCFYDPTGEETGCIRLPLGDNFRLEGFDGNRIFLSGQKELVCFDTSGKPLWHADTTLFSEDSPHFITRDGRFVVVGRGAHMTFNALPLLGL